MHISFTNWSHIYIAMSLKMSPITFDTPFCVFSFTVNIQNFFWTEDLSKAPFKIMKKHMIM